MKYYHSYPKGKAFDTFKKNYLKQPKESLLDNKASKQGQSIDKALFNFYKAKSKGLVKESQLDDYSQNFLQLPYLQGQWDRV